MITLVAFRDGQFVCLPAGSGLHTILTTAAAQQGFPPRIQFETAGPASIRELVAAGLGVALLAESAALGPGPTVDVHYLDPAPRHPPIGTVRLRDRADTPTVRAWQHHLERTYRSA